MAVNELDRDYLRLLHMCDQIENVIGGMKMSQETDAEKKKQVGNMVMHLEIEVLDSKWTDAKKDLTRVNSVIATGRTYWKS
tara:strand:+ start:113 stop:355 length:243 start_codon:yes stop_codon:yes gene_type:complete